MASASDIMECLRQIDDDNDGTIHRRELAVLFGSALEPALDMFDVNGNGRIQYTSFVEWAFSGPQAAESSNVNCRNPQEPLEKHDDENADTRRKQTCAAKLWRIAVIGSGNWGSVAARLAAQNALVDPGFEDEVRMWVYEEQVNGEKLTNIINSRHENPKYLAGVNLGENVRAYPDLAEAVRDASLLIFVVPHQFLKGLFPMIKANMAKDAKAISLIKGCDITDDGFQLFSQLIHKSLAIETSVLMGANLANDIAQEEFSEATVGYPRSSGSGQLWKRVFNRAYFEVNPVPDVSGVELCGTLKNIVAIGAGIVDGMGWGPNTKAAVIRIGFGEMRKLARMFYPTVLDDTFWESSGIADVITTCTGGRNRRCSAAFAEAVSKGKPKTWVQLENDLLGGMKLQGVLTSFEVQEILRRKSIEADFPLFTTIYKIASLELPPCDIIRYREQGKGSSGQVVVA